VQTEAEVDDAEHKDEEEDGDQRELDEGLASLSAPARAPLPIVSQHRPGGPPAQTAVFTTVPCHSRAAW
jgi:hypothetical protein